MSMVRSVLLFDMKEMMCVMLTWRIIISFESYHNEGV